MARILYKPFGLVVGVLGGVIAGALFKRAWKVVAHEDEAPEATDESRGWGEVVTAQQLRARSSAR